MGLDPQRPHSNDRWDYLMVAAALIICVAAVTWAML